MVFHIDAATGEDATGQIARADVLEGIDVVQGPIVESYLLEHEGQKVVMFLDEYLQVRPTLASSLNFVLMEAFRLIHIPPRLKLLNF